MKEVKLKGIVRSCQIDGMISGLLGSSIEITDKRLTTSGELSFKLKKENISEIDFDKKDEVEIIIRKR